MPNMPEYEKREVPTGDERRTGDFRGRRSADLEAINHPAHYGGDTVYEAVKVIEAWGLGFHLGNCVKYIARAGRKTPDAIQDLEKAAWYLNREVQRLKAQEAASRDYTGI